MMTKFQLPKMFEPFKSTKIDRRKIKRVLRDLPLPIKKEIDFPSRCHKGQRCLSGLCPTCMRNFRRKFLRFAHQERLASLRWSFVTVLIDGWTIKAGVYDNFGPLKDHAIIKQILQRFRRLQQPRLILFGSIETVYQKLDSDPIGKPFHLHMMISGASKKAIHKCLNVPESLSTTSAIPIHVKLVGSTYDDFVRAASYTIKQPFWEQRKSSKSKFKPRRFPTRLALGELLSNYGQHHIGGRTFYIGIRYQHSQFSFTDNVKSVITDKIAQKAKLIATPLPKTTASRE